MAQDFQDLTGQVIKKMMDVIKDMETQLLQLLIDNAPPEKRQDAGHGLLNGPQIKIGNADAVDGQARSTICSPASVSEMLGLWRVFVRRLRGIFIRR